MIIRVTDQQGNTHKIDGVEGWRLMEVIRDSNLPIKAECGGCLSCGTCHVYVDDKWKDKLYPPHIEETERLEDDAFHVKPNSRLSCQIILDETLDGLEVTLAPGTEP